MAAASACYALTSYYEKVFKDKYSDKPVVNKHRARWGFDAMLQGESAQKIRELIDYYFTTASPRRHSLDWFFSNYDKLESAMGEHQKDAVLREKLRRESAERSKAWKERIGNPGIESN